MDLPDRDIAPAASSRGPSAEPPVVLEHQGVPVVLERAPGDRAEGGIVFRVGTADERAASAGISHLVEHLVVGAARGGSPHENGTTTSTGTYFHTAGSVDEVLSYITSVTRVLAALPLERLDAEKQIILVEGGSRPAGDPLRLLRYGAAGYGIAHLPEELGMHRLTETEVREWARTRFTRSAAAVFLSLPVAPTTPLRLPAGLDLSALPEGPRPPAPVLEDRLQQLPAASFQSVGGIVLESVVERTAAAAVTVGVLRRDLFRRLREERGLSYRAEARQEPRDAAWTHLRILADARPETVHDVTAEVLEAVRSLRERPLAPAQLVQAIDDVTRAVRETPPSAEAPGWAMDLLQGRSPVTDAQFLAEVARVREQDVLRVAEQLLGSALVLCDPACRAQLEQSGFALAQEHPVPPAHDGVRFARYGFSAQGVAIGSEVVEQRGPRGVRRIALARCPAVLAWPDGARALMSPDGTGLLMIEPTLHSGLSARRLQELIDARVGPERIIPMPPRERGAIPRFGARQILWTLALILLLALGIPLLIAAVVAGATDGVGTGIGLGVLALPFCLGAAWMITARRRKG